MVEPPKKRVRWRPCWRLVSSRFPPEGLFDRVVDSEDIEIVAAIEGLTNDRLRQELGELHLVPESERQFGEGTTPIMAAFTHINRDGSRFSDGFFGVYYAARKVETAIAETRYHRERFLRCTSEVPLEIDMRSYRCDIDVSLHDIRENGGDYDQYHDPDCYAASQQLAVTLRALGSKGIVYNSVRHEGGQCVALFRADIPKAPVTQGPHFCFVWDGECITRCYQKTVIE
ncbi:hypothetical protein AB833_03175 [Chromatiales bacterium (ex Bugula neritina AB1)]|nr:hypothetical protein AB833_03175 [Chromatiales bacterium (ex Bugula neritina AB1)]